MSLRGHSFLSTNPEVPIWLWGLIICMVATALTALGLVLQKYSYTLNAHKQQVLVYYRQPWWLVGFALFVFAQVMNLASMSMAPQVMLSCLGATALIFNIVFACLILGEEVHTPEILAMLGMVCGVCMVISTTPILEVETAEGGVLQEVVAPLFSFPFVGSAAFLIVVLLSLRFVVGAMSCVKGFAEFDPLTWVLCSAASSGYTVNLFKAASEFIMAWTVTKPYLHWECYVTLLAAVLVAVAQMHCLNKALNTGRAMMVVPTYFALSMLAQLGVSELVVADLPTSCASAVIFTCGIVLILVFIVMLVRAKIAYEEKPDAEFDEVFEKILPGSPTAASQDDIKEPTEASALLTPKDRVPGFLPRAASLPPTSMVPDEESPSAGYSPLRARCASFSSFESASFRGSFEGRERTYTVSVIGLGIA